MPRRYNLNPQFFSPPSEQDPFMQITFRLPFESRDPIYPASGLQLSFERPEHEQEIFLERITSRDITMSDSGLCSLKLPQSEVPKYASKPGMKEDGVVVKLHAWKGETHLGMWEVGTLDGPDNFIIAA